ncbi:MAG: protein translocase subunit SecD, partial [Steroidobacter sp.]
MYQIPKWRYWLVGIVLAASLLLALPNLFGDEVAIQLAREDRVAMDEGAHQRIDAVLEAEKITPTASYLEEGRLVIRFAHVDDQIRARDAISEATAGDYVIALTSVPRTPAILRSIGLKPMSLGLDLRGGAHLLLSMETADVRKDWLETLRDDARRR